MVAALVVLMLPTTASARVTHIRFHKAIRALTVAKQSHQSSYDRDKQFGDWITQYGECDTRAVVLIDESLKPVTKNDYCTVSKGKWFSYYNGRYYRNAYGGKVQIDHTVPVYDAWTSGAWRWTKATRVRYYNDLRDARTLVKQGDDPTGWLPSHGVCRYLRYWVAVKSRWHLSITKAEKYALLTIGSCPNRKLRIKTAKVVYK
jgi:hypothetical protein